MSGHNIRNFIEKVKNDDLARSNRFEVVINKPPILSNHPADASVLSMLVEDGMFPGILVGTRPLRINNLNEQRANVIDFGGDSITFTFLVDTFWTGQTFFSDWMRSIVDPTSRYLIYPEQYYSTIEITALNNRDETVAYWKLIDAFPRSIAPITPSVTSAQVLRMPITFAYKKWVPIQEYFDESLDFNSEFDGEQLQLDDDTGGFI